MSDADRKELHGLYECTLQDAWDDNPTAVRCEAEFDGYTAWLRPEGCGGGAGREWPIKLEYFEGEVWLVVWGDINQEDATHRISLTCALLSNRRTNNA